MLNIGCSTDTMKRVQTLAPGEFYHIYNRGVLKRKIFLDDRDRARFLLSLLYFQGPETIDNPGRLVTRYVEHRMFNTDRAMEEKITRERGLRLIAFALMPNHFHLIVEEVKEGGISKYMQRVGNSYTKYFNTKYQASGYLFQGAFKFSHIGDNEQLLYASAYIHRNCCELTGWRNKAHKYPWSSYQDFLSKNRWSNLLHTEPIREQFAKSDDYHEWVQTSGAKDLAEIVEHPMFNS